MKKMIACVLVSIFVSIYAHAQGSATGCLLPNNRVYTNPGAIIPTYYYSNFYVELSDNYCSWTPSTGPACTVCFGGLNVLGVCLGSTGVAGVQGTFTMVPCDLDGKSPIILLLACILGVRFIFNKSKSEQPVG